MMKLRSKVLIAAVGLVLVSATFLFALDTTQFWKIITNNTLFQNDVAIKGTFHLGDGTPGQTIAAEAGYVEGLLEVDGMIHADGGVTGGVTGAVIGSTGSYTGNVTLDDSAGASPSIIFIDGTDETATFTKADSGNLSMTIGTTDSLQVLTGNLRVGNGAPGQTINGEDTYLEGLVEIDGVLYADGGAVLSGAISGTQDALTTSGAVNVYGATTWDGTSAGGNGAALTLASATYIGQQVTVVCIEATTSATLSITNHETSDPEAALFDAVDEYIQLLWTGTEWATVSNSCTFP